MRDRDCVAFLQWCLPRLGLRWSGYRKVRGTVCKRVQRRLRALDLTADSDGLNAYKTRLENDASERQILDAFCRIPISRFYRDRAVFDALGSIVLPRLARAYPAALRCWSAGCASGEEAYSLSILWRLNAAQAAQETRFSVLGTDTEPEMLKRAQRARYGAGSLKDLPAAYRDAAFVRDHDEFVLKPAFRAGVRFALHDLRTLPPDGPFALVLCRNLAFTYFETGLQAAVLARLRQVLAPGGVLVIGGHETLPDTMGFARYDDAKLPIFRKL